MSAHPYSTLADSAFWRRSVSNVPYSQVDPVAGFNLKVDPISKVATAGSCFAQHIAKRLSAGGYNYFVSERAHPIMPESVAKVHNYGLFSARYGNIYTARQLLQLMRRAYGDFEPADHIWWDKKQAIVDAFRPTTQPGGYISKEELLDDRAYHLNCVRRMFEELDVFVFTLGLTECWRSRIDGAVYPICPGVEAGEFDPAKYEFYNQPLSEILADLSEIVERLSQLNAGANIIITVSPVPLMATAESDASVLMATTYSKSVLRVAAEEVRRKYSQVHYFPSYEIITGHYTRGRYYAEDLRNVTDEGVDHVMQLFLKHAYGSATAASRPSRDLTQQSSDIMAKFQAVVCDEEKLDSRP